MSKTTKKIVFYVVMAILLVIFVYCAYNLGVYLLESFLTKRDNNERAKEHSSFNISRPAVTDSAVTPVETQPGTPETTPPVETAPEFVTITHPTTGEQMEILPEFESLFLENPDTVGWIEIPGTPVSNVVVQSPGRVDYYLHRDFNKKYNLHGCIYVREQCDVNLPSDNITIYGHRMKDGSMFAHLVNYTKQNFYENNRYIYFDTLTERHTYQIFAVFKTTATLGQGFQYHLFVDAASEDAFNDYVNTCKRKSLYDTGLTPQYGDKLITLSTCEYSQDNGRLVIVAVRVA